MLLDLCAGGKRWSWRGWAVSAVSVSKLLAVIQQPEACGAHFRSPRDPIVTRPPQGMFSI
jgi:hypothetical protein